MIKRILFTFLLSFLLSQIHYCVRAQQTKINQFEERLKAVNSLKNVDPDKAFRVISDLIDDAHRLSLPVQEAKGLLIKGVIVYNKDDNAKAFNIFNEALSLFQSAGDKSGMAKAYNNLGGASAALNKPEKALDYQLKALDIRVAINDPLLASSYNMIGNIYLDQGNYPKAADYYLKGLPVSEKNNDKLGQSSLLNNIGLVYWKQKRYADAFIYMSQCLTLEKEGNDYKAIAGSYNNLAGIRMDQDQYDPAFMYCREAIQYAEKVNFTKELARSYSVMGDIAYRQGNYTDALKYGLKGLELRRKVGREKDIVMSLIKLGETHVALGNYNDAEKVCKEGLLLANKNNLAKEKESLYRMLGVVYNKKGDWKSAYENSVKHDQAKDSVFNESNSKFIFDLQAQYETTKKQNQIIILSKDNNIKSLQLQNSRLELNKNRFIVQQQQQALTINSLELRNNAQQLKNQQLFAEKKNRDMNKLNDRFRIQQLELDNRNRLIIIILIAVMASGLLVYLFYNRYKARQSEQLKQEVQKQQEIATKSIFEGEQNERIRIARDLHDSIGQMMSVIKMNVSNLNHKYPADNHIDNTLTLVDKTITEVRHISHNLIPEELNFGLFAALEDMFNKINAGTGTKINFNIPDEARKHQFEKSNQLSIYRIVQEVVGNIVKHADATQIFIDVLREPNQLTIAIKDNGNGFDTGQIKNSKGIGWKNIAARVNLLDGNMQIRSEKLSGTQIEITIPNDNNQG
ncbi:MAG: sensor histidine kinase [Bacteroidota bacterium]